MSVLKDNMCMQNGAMLDVVVVDVVVLVLAVKSKTSWGLIPTKTLRKVLPSIGQDIGVVTFCPLQDR